VLALLIGMAVGTYSSIFRRQQRAASRQPHG
jgi:hypothetical protein